VTGAVTGGGVGAWSWLAVLLGLIAVVTVGYLYVRSQK
jgi:hypothetical protein